MLKRHEVPYAVRAEGIDQVCGVGESSLFQGIKLRFETGALRISEAIGQLQDVSEQAAAARCVGASHFSCQGFKRATSFGALLVEPTRVAVHIAAHVL